MVSGRRKGISIVECIILIIVVLVAIGAIYTTIAWSQLSYLASRRDRDSREVLFSWNQAFETLWASPVSVPPAKSYQIPAGNPSHLSGMSEAGIKDALDECFEDVADIFLTSFDTGAGTCEIDGFSVAAAFASFDSAVTVVNLKISDESRMYVEVERKFNNYSSAPVSSDLTGNA